MPAAVRLRWREGCVIKAERGSLDHSTGRSDGVVSGVRAIVAALLLLEVALGAGPAYGQEDEDDPLEPVNRAIFEFNRVFDGLLLKPAAIMYRAATPQLMRDGVDNFLKNLRAPVVFFNDLFQGEFERAEKTLGRFMLNTIMGLGGIIDIGGHVGMPPRHGEDFGQTLAIWGVGEGPYLMLPLLGPSTLRDGVGKVVDVGLDPLTVIGAAGVGIYVNPTGFGVARTGAEALDFRERNLETIDELERSSLDLYATVRTTYLQLRANEIRNGEAAPLEDIYDEDIYDESLFEEDIDDPDASQDEPAEGTEGR
jgi:phospholipid-binding lipoprotein MlaA